MILPCLPISAFGFFVPSLHLVLLTQKGTYPSHSLQPVSNSTLDHISSCFSMIALRKSSSSSLSPWLPTHHPQPVNVQYRLPLQNHSNNHRNTSLASKFDSCYRPVSYPPFSGKLFRSEVIFSDSQKGRSIMTLRLSVRGLEVTESWNAAQPSPCHEILGMLFKLPLKVSVAIKGDNACSAWTHEN